MILDAIIIYRVIAVIIRIRAPRLVALVGLVRVVVPRRQPNRGDAELLQIIEMIGDAFEIPAVPRPENMRSRL